MEYLTTSKRSVKRTVNVKRGKKYIPHYDDRTFDEIPVTLVDWRGDIPPDVIITNEEEMEIIIPIEECVKLYDDLKIICE